VKSFKLTIHGDNYWGLGEVVGEPYFALGSLSTIMF
jgi:hypothetical protein